MTTRQCETHNRQRRDQCNRNGHPRQRVGDVIPLEVPDKIEVCAEDLPIFRGTLGVHNNSYAVKVSEWIERSTAGQLHDLLSDTTAKEGTRLVPSKRD